MLLKQVLKNYCRSLNIHGYHFIAVRNCCQFEKYLPNNQIEITRVLWKSQRSALQEVFSKTKYQHITIKIVTVEY